MRRPFTALLLPICVAALVGGCNSDDKSDGSRAGETAPPARRIKAPAGIAGPRKVEPSGAVGARAVEKLFGRELSPGQPVVIGAACTHGDCVVRYRSEARGGGFVVSNQFRILRPLFSRQDVRSVTLLVHHWSTGTPDKNEAPVFATTICRRAEHPDYKWERIGPADVVRVCHYTHDAGGKLRSEVRRGKLNNKQASQGQGGGGGQGQGQGQGNGPQGPK